MRNLDFGPVTWRTSSYSSDTSNCVEVAFGGAVGVRDSKNAHGGTLSVSATAWRALLVTVR